MSVIIEEKPAPRVVLLKFNRPQARNAFNTEVRETLMATMARLQQDEDLRCVIITGDERSFAAGADIGEMAGAGPVQLHRRNVEAFWNTVPAFPRPVIAVVRGFAFGAGCELAMQCDIILAGQSARFALPEVRLGIMPGGGGTQRLPRIVGRPAALRYLLTGDSIDAGTALTLGLVSEVIADDEVLDKALEIAKSISHLAPLAVAKIRESVNYGLDAALQSGLRLERDAYYFLNATEDKAEGVSAFLEKRTAMFKGR